MIIFLFKILTETSGEVKMGIGIFKKELKFCDQQISNSLWLGTVNPKLIFK